MTSAVMQGHEGGVIWGCGKGQTMQIRKLPVARKPLQSEVTTSDTE